MNIKASSSICELVFGELQALQIAPKRLTDINSWHGHIPFAFWLVKKLKPSVFVQLGVNKGDSYSAFCQAVQLFSLNTTCYGVVPWKQKSDDLLEELICQEYSAYHDENYASFSQLICNTFDDALYFFADGSVDLLHINGQNGYEEVKHTFEAWLPKFSSRAVVLFNDINVLEKEIGVWKFFYELTQQYLGRTFSFIHCHGLGVLIVGEKAPDNIQQFCQVEDKDAMYIRLAFSTFGKLVKARANKQKMHSKIDELNTINRQMITDRRKTEIECYKYEIDLASALQEKERQVEEVSSALQEKERQVEEVSSALQEKERQVEEVSSALQEKERQVEEVDRVNAMLMRSLSMRLTKPLRYLNSIAHRFL